MRVFTTECKDTVTGYAMVLSECSYNMACDWLERTLKKYRVKIYDCRVNPKTGFTELTTGKFYDTLGRYELCRRYFYDETRGFLLGE